MNNFKYTKNLLYDMYIYMINLSLHNDNYCIPIHRDVVLIKNIFNRLFYRLFYSFFKLQQTI